MPRSQTLALVMMKIASSDQAEEKLNRFFTYLKAKNLIMLLPQIRNHVLRMQEQSDTHNTLTVSSRYPLSESDKNDIKELVGADESISFIEILNEDNLGSFTAEFRGHIYDGSLSKALSEMNRILTH